MHFIFTPSATVDVDDDAEDARGILKWVIQFRVLSSGCQSYTRCYDDYNN